MHASNVVSIREVKKGAEVMLTNGWTAKVEDNKVTSQTRLCTVYGTYTELGSVYSSDIVKVLVNGSWEHVVHTPSQVKMAVARKGWGF